LRLFLSGATPAEALRNTLDLAQHAERWSYRRYREAASRA
jgi:phage portal protein BeeE